VSVLQKRAIVSPPNQKARTHMAKNDKAPQSASSPSEYARPPVGYQLQGSVSGAPWFKLSDGAVCHGKLLGKSSRKDPKSPTGSSFFYQIETVAECKATEGKGADATITSVPAGAVVNFNYTKKASETLDPFLPSILAGGEVNVWILVKKKLTTQSGNSYWDMEIRVAPTATSAVGEDDEPEFSDEA